MYSNEHRTAELFAKQHLGQVSKKDNCILNGYGLLAIAVSITLGIHLIRHHSNNRDLASAICEERGITADTVVCPNEDDRITLCTRGFYDPILYWTPSGFLLEEHIRSGKPLDEFGDSVNTQDYELVSLCIDDVRGEYVNSEAIIEASRSAKETAE